MRPRHVPTSRLLSVVLVGALAAPAAADLTADIERAMRSPELIGASVAVSVRDADSGSELVAIAGDEPMIPASNMKLLTTGAALHVLGAEFSFRTRLIRDGDRLIVVGDGDPAFGDPDLLALMELDGADGIDVETFLNIWIEAVRGSGLEAVSEVVVDDRIFDRTFVHETWPADQLERAYCAQVAGLNFHLNVLHLYPRPSTGPRPDISNIVPGAPWLKLSNRATAEIGGDTPSNAWLARRMGTNELTVRGNVKHAYRKPLTVTVHDPPLFFAGLLASRLEAAGIAVGGHRVVRPEESRSSGDLVGPAIATPMSTVITRANRDSENLYAEALLKRIGHEVGRQSGSWSNGAAVVRHVIFERLGPAPTARILVADGSGLSRANRITAAALTSWLNSFHQDETLGPTFIDSLAMAGRDGTLQQRFAQVELHGGLVHGKSGYINGVSCLSGYVTAPSGARRSFSILANNLRPEDIRRAKRLQERIVSLIAEDMAGARVTQGSD